MKVSLQNIKIKHYKENKFKFNVKLMIMKINGKIQNIKFKKQIKFYNNFIKLNLKLQIKNKL